MREPITFDVGPVDIVSCAHQWRYVDFRGSEFFYCPKCKRREDPDTGELLPN